MELQKILERTQEIRSVFKSESAVVAAYLFGSVATERPTPFSDVDFAVLLSADAPNGLELFSLLDRLACGLSKLLGISDQSIDMVPLNEAGLVFQYSVLRSGRLLYESNTKARRLFEWRIVCEYLDFKPTLEIYDRSSRRKRPA